MLTIFEISKKRITAIMRWNVLFLLALLLGLTAALQCEDGTNCPDHATCCQMESGSFGCCPYEEAVCCQQDYCCPQFGRCDGARCQLGNGLEIAAARRFPAFKTATEALHYQQQQQQQQQAGPNESVIATPLVDFRITSS